MLRALTPIATACLVVGTAIAAEKSSEEKVAVTFSGGHDIGKNDYGRPVVLIAAGLCVEPELFRKAFSGVTPAKGGPPSREQIRRNKQALLKVLGPHGVTNERLDEVSDYYRFKPQDGELWPTKDAKAHAIIEDGKIKKIVVTDRGSGYCSTPKVSIEGFEDTKLKVTLGFRKELEKNGTIDAIEVEAAENAASK